MWLQQRQLIDLSNSFQDTKILLIEDLCARMLKKKVKEIKQQPLPLVRIALEKKNAATASAIYIYECELHC